MTGRMLHAYVWRILLATGLCLASVGLVYAAGGPLGIDYRLGYDNAGIWTRKYQLDLQDIMIAGEFAGGIWEGGKTRLGRTFWQAIDSSALAALSTQALKYTFTRARPYQSPDPNKWFQGLNHYSFPSGEVANASAIVTPFILEYRKQHPSVYALELLPLYDGWARMKVWGHWQSDVLAGWALGTFTGYLAHTRKSPFILSLLPGGFEVGLHEQF